MRKSSITYDRRQNATGGVTLLELMVVIALASILLAVVFPSVGAGIANLELRSSAQRVAAASRYAREQAIHDQSSYELAIDAQARRISLRRIGGQEDQGIRTAELPAGVKIVRLEPVTEDEAVPGRLIGRYVFYPDGGVPHFKVALENARRQITVESDPLTGFAKVSEP